MELKHLDLSVPEVQETKTFFEKYFGFHSRPMKHHDNMTVLQDDNGFTLVLSKETDAHYPERFHIGFYLDSPEQVKALYQRFKDGGFQFAYEFAETKRGILFYIHAPGSILVEVNCPTV